MVDVASLLPPTAAPLERNIEQSATGAMEHLPVPIRDLWNPDTCPAHLLPWLAWALDVAQWQSDWPEATQRAAIKASIRVHDTQGTAQALKDAVAAIWGDSAVSEWFDYGGQPYHFRVDLTVLRAGLDASTWANLDAMIYEAANARSKLDSISVYMRQSLFPKRFIAPVCAEIMTLMPPVLGNADQLLPRVVAMTTYDAETTSIYPQGAVI